jgi:hypothetical protein
VVSAGGLEGLVVSTGGSAGFWNMNPFIELAPSGPERATWPEAPVSTTAVITESDKTE